MVVRVGVPQEGYGAPQSRNAICGKLVQRLLEGLTRPCCAVAYNGTISQLANITGWQKWSRHVLMQDGNVLHEWLLCADEVILAGAESVTNEYNWQILRCELLETISVVLT